MSAMSGEGWSSPKAAPLHPGPAPGGSSHLPCVPGTRCGTEGSKPGSETGVWVGKECSKGVLGAQGSAYTHDGPSDTSALPQGWSGYPAEAATAAGHAATIHTFGSVEGN